jgi:hypothetical protein
MSVGSGQVFPGRLAVRAPARQQPPGAVTEPDGSRPVCPGYAVRARSAVSPTMPSVTAGFITITGSGMATRSSTCRTMAVSQPGTLCMQADAGKQAAITLTGLATGSRTRACISASSGHAARLQLSLARMLTRPAKGVWSGRTSRIIISVSRISCRCVSLIITGTITRN